MCVSRSAGGLSADRTGQTGNKNYSVEYIVGLTIKKVDADTYAFSGNSFEEADVRGKLLYVAYLYSRKTRQIIKQ